MNRRSSHSDRMCTITRGPAPAEYRLPALLLALLLLSLPGSAGAARLQVEERWGPPLPPPLRLTGTFGEYRSGHLHAGIDLSTRGQSGMPVLAVDSGSVVRVRAGAYGYGRALYLQTGAGPLAVYGHLESFAEPIEAELLARQTKSGEYEIDFWLPPGTLRFARGDTIAHSGATGVGPPHLHFELRDSDRPFNPLTHGLRISDPQGPVIGPLALRAQRADAWVGTGHKARVDLPDTDPVPVWGAVGVECRFVDRSGTTTARLTPYSVRLFLDGRRVFARRFDRIDFTRDHEVDRIYGQLLREEGPFSLRLYRWPPGAGVDQTDPWGLAGTVRFDALPPGRHSLCVEVTEASGFETAASWDVTVRPPLLPVAWRAARTAGGPWQLGLQLAVPLDSLRLPLRLLWEAVPEASPEEETHGGTPAARSGEGEWAALGEGWFALPLDASGPLDLEVRDEGRRALIPTLRIGADPARWQPPQAEHLELEMDEGMVLFRVRAPQPFPGLPVAEIELADRHRVRLHARGGDACGRWLFATEPGSFRGVAQRLLLSFPDTELTCALPLSGLVGFARGDESARSCDPPAGATKSGGSGKGEESVLPAGRLTLRPRADSFYGPTILRAEFLGPADSLWTALIDSAGRIAWRADDPEQDRRLPLVGPLLHLGAPWWPLQSPLQVRIGAQMLSADQWDPQRSGLCRIDRDGDCSWIGGRHTGDSWEAELQRLGAYVLLEDRAPPQITTWHPENGAHLIAAPTRLQAEVVEVGSGFDPRDADIRLDGVMLRAVWDVDERLLWAEPFGNLEAGPHTWSVEIVDRVGNRAQRSFTFEIAGP